MRRRLTLAGGKELASTEGLVRDRSLGERAIGLVDSARGETAVTFSVALASALSERGASVRVAWLAYDAAPGDFGEAAERLLTRGIELRRLAVQAAQPELSWPAHEAAGPDVWSLLVGLPALLSFSPRLAILLDAERPVTSWPRPLLARRGAAHLALSGGRPSLAPALAEALLAWDLLRRGEHGVR